MTISNGSEIHRVHTRDDTIALVRLLDEPDRLPLIVVTIPEWSKGPDVDVDDLAKQLDGAALVFVVDAKASFDLTDHLGAKNLSVHSGWVRIYPPGQAWRKNPRLAPSFRPTRNARRRSLQQIVGAALDASVIEGYRPVIAPVTTSTLTKAEVTVTAVITATQAMVVHRESRVHYLLRTAQIATGLPADRLVKKGQVLRGRLGPGNVLPDFIPDRIDDDVLARAIEFVDEGITTLAQVKSVKKNKVTLLLHPAITLTITGSDDEDLSVMADVGEVVAVDVIYVDQQFIVSFSGDDPSPSIAYLPDGPPWLVPQPEIEEDDLIDDLVDEVVEPPSARAIDELRELIDFLEDQLAEQTAQNRKLRQDLRESRRVKVPRVYLDPEKQFRFEVELSYLSRVTEVNREIYPWPKKYFIGDSFIESLDKMVQSGGIKREKLIDVCTDIICDQAKDNPSRVPKPWTDGAHGPQITRADGAKMMRVRAQSGTAAARRIRYWQLRTGAIELDEVLTHTEDLYN